MKSLMIETPPPVSQLHVSSSYALRLAARVYARRITIINCNCHDPLTPSPHRCYQPGCFIVVGSRSDFTTGSVGL